MSSPYSRLVLVTEEEFSFISGNPSPESIAVTNSSIVGPDQQYRVKAVVKQEEKIKREIQQDEQEAAAKKQPNSKLDVIDRISSDLPKSRLTKAIALVTFLRSNFPSVSWDEGGQLVDSGEVITGSYLPDLIQYAVHDSRKGASVIPPGWNEFKEVLKKLNIPRSYISRATIEELGVTRRRPRPERSPSPARRPSRARVRQQKVTWVED